MVTAVVTFYSNKPPITERFRAAAEVVPVDVYRGPAHRPGSIVHCTDSPGKKQWEK